MIIQEMASPSKPQQHAICCMIECWLKHAVGIPHVAPTSLKPPPRSSLEAPSALTSGDADLPIAKRSNGLDQANPSSPRDSIQTPQPNQSRVSLSLILKIVGSPGWHLVSNIPQ